MLIPLITAVLALLIPKAPGWLASTLAAVVPAVFEVVDELQKARMPGPQKLEVAVTEIGRQFDEAFDSVPQWSELSERRRDIILKGLVELTLFAASLPKGRSARDPRAGVQKALRMLKKRQ